jgi:Ca-activated chloride channel family protein
MSTLPPNNLTTNFQLPSLSFEGFTDHFHFIRPEWLLAFIALAIILYILKKIRYYQSPWQHFLPAHLAANLLENSDKQPLSSDSSPLKHILKPLIIGTCAIIALAGPAWQKLPQPVYQLARGSVVIMDMSYSMYATDVKPNRLTRARYKAIDLLDHINEGDVGLIAYAGDAFVISPLTQDINNIALLLPSLSPDIMPVVGANPFAALSLADKTLKNSGHLSGDIYWFTDDVEQSEMSDIYDWMNNTDHTLNILGIGSKTGAPIKLNSGELLKDSRGAIVIPQLPEERLAALSQRGGGEYHLMTNSDKDIKAITAELDKPMSSKSADNGSNQQDKNKQVMQGDQYREQGPWLLFIIIPFLLSYFRRGSEVLIVTGLIPATLWLSLLSLSLISQQSMAAESTNTQTSAFNDSKKNSNNQTSSIWQNLWRTQDQQAQYLYEQENFQGAAEKFKNSQWQASAHYKAEDYEKALQAFKQDNSATGLFNQGNSLAQLQKIDEAIEAYQQALAKNPDFNEAKENLANLEAIKKQQQEQQQQNSQDGADNSDENKQSNNSSEQQKQQGSDSNQEQQQQEQQQGDQSEQQNAEDNDQQSTKESTEQAEQSPQQNQQANPAEQDAEEQKQQDAQTAAEQELADDTDTDKSLAQQAIDSKAKETEQKHQQLFNKVTDDPYLLLRNKMQLEYQKRRNEGANQGVTKQW